MTITILNDHNLQEYLVTDNVTHVIRNDQSTDIHFSDGSKKETKSSFAQVVNQLHKHFFYEVEESLCINLKYIADIKKDESGYEEMVYLKNGNTVAVDNRKMTDLKYKLMNYDSSFIQKLQANY
jgi:DNA-binding LytR/AlgR family response regulator